MVVTIAPNELSPLKTIMRDLQLAAANYYAATASGGELGSTVRSFITNCQTLNDWLTSSIIDAATYKTSFRSPRLDGAGVIEAIKYVRNISQHVLHVVEPSDTVTLVGGTFGYRTYLQWEPVPEGVHAQLHRVTQGLLPAYQANLEGKEMMSTMMAVLRFFSKVTPSIVHRDQYGEWTGFPLMSQPGISDPLHPEEPRGNIQQARAWMDNRRPNGDSRVICGQVSIDEVPYVYGYTFVGRLAFTPFYETVPQIHRDIALGFPYLKGTLSAHAIDVSEEHPDALQGQVVGSREDLADWTTPVGRIESVEDWCSPGLDRDSWDRRCGLEAGTLVPDFVAYGIRRARRLNALVPPRHH
jgi:hypothetical protein